MADGSVNEAAADTALAGAQTAYTAALAAFAAALDDLHTSHGAPAYRELVKRSEEGSLSPLAVSSISDWMKEKSFPSLSNTLSLVRAIVGKEYTAALDTEWRQRWQKVEEYKKKARKAAPRRALADTSLPRAGQGTTIAAVQASSGIDASTGDPSGEGSSLVAASPAAALEPGQAESMLMPLLQLIAQGDDFHAARLLLELHERSGLGAQLLWQISGKTISAAVDVLDCVDQQAGRQTGDGLLDALRTFDSDTAAQIADERADPPTAIPAPPKPGADLLDADPRLFTTRRVAAMITQGKTEKGVAEFVRLATTPPDPAVLENPRINAKYRDIDIFVRMVEWERTAGYQELNAVIETARDGVTVAGRLLSALIADSHASLVLTALRGFAESDSPAHQQLAGPLMSAIDRPKLVAVLVEAAKGKPHEVEERGVAVLLNYAPPAVIAGYLLATVKQEKTQDRTALWSTPVLVAMAGQDPHKTATALSERLNTPVSDVDADLVGRRTDVAGRVIRAFAEDPDALVRVFADLAARSIVDAAQLVREWDNHPDPVIVRSAARLLAAYIDAVPIDKMRWFPTRAADIAVQAGLPARILEELCQHYGEQSSLLTTALASEKRRSATCAQLPYLLDERANELVRKLLTRIDWEDPNSETWKKTVNAALDNGDRETAHRYLTMLSQL